MKSAQVLSFPYSYDPSSPNCSVNWKHENASYCLNCQIMTNYIKLRELELQCQKLKKDVWTSDPEREICLKFLSQIREYKTILELDDVIFEHSKNIDAIVLLYHGEYYGHLYIWKSKYHNFIVIGARSRVDDLFVDNTFYNSLDYLMEGVKQYVQNRGGENFIVLYPTPRTEIFLKKMNGTRIQIPKEYIHDEILGEDICTKCYQIENLKSSSNENFVYYEL